MKMFQTSCILAAFLCIASSANAQYNAAALSQHNHGEDSSATDANSGGSANSILGENRPVCFNSIDNGMAWPMAEFENNPMRSVAHGVHCLEMQNQFNRGEDVTDPLLLVHIVHCNDVLTKMLADMTANRYKYETTNAVCNFVGNPPQRVKRLTGWFKYGRKRRSVSTGVIRIQPVNGSYSTPQANYESQDEAFAIMGAENFGRLIIKHFYDPNLMTADEQRYMRFTHSETATFLAGLGVVCTHGVNYEKGLAALEKVVNGTAARRWTTPASKEQAHRRLSQMLGEDASATEKLANLKNLLTQIKIDLTGDEPEETEEPLSLNKDFEAAALHQSIPLPSADSSNQEKLILATFAFVCGAALAIILVAAVSFFRPRLGNRRKRQYLAGNELANPFVSSCADRERADNAH